MEFWEINRVWCLHIHCNFHFVSFYCYSPFGFYRVHSTLLVIVDEWRVFVTLCFNLTSVETWERMHVVWRVKYFPCPAWFSSFWFIYCQILFFLALLLFVVPFFANFVRKWFMIFGLVNFYRGVYFLMLLNVCFTCGLGATCRLIDFPLITYV